MKKNVLFRMGIAFAVVVLFVGVSVLPATGSILLEESLKSTEKSSVYVKSQSITKDLDYDKYQLNQHDRDTNSRFITKERFSPIPRDLIEYEELGSSYKYSVDMDISFKGNYMPHDPIEIEGNDEFTAANGVTGGNGTSDDPYIIEGWEIIATSAAAIDIAFTTAYFIIRHCYFKAGVCGVLLYSVTHGTIDDIVVPAGTPIGVYTEGWASDLVIKNSTFTNDICLRLKNTNHVSVSNCSITSSASLYAGVQLSSSNYVDLSNLSVKNGMAGILAVSSHYTTIKDCDVFSNYFGIDLIASKYVVMRNNTIYNNIYGFHMGSLVSFDDYIHDIDTSNTIDGKPIYYLRNASNLVFDGSEGIGFLGFVECDNITVKNFNMSNSGNALIFAGSRDCTVSQSVFTNNLMGIDCMWSFNISITDCVCDDTGAGYGIWIGYSSHTMMRNNKIITGDEPFEFGFGVYGDTFEDFMQDIDKSNTINGKPIYYLVGEENIRITKSTELGYLALVNCRNVKVINVVLTNNEQGLLLVNTTGIIRGCRFSFNYAGIQILGDAKITIFSCTVNRNQDGFHMEQTSNVRVIRCRVSNTDFFGFYFHNSHDNLIVGCTIAQNGYYGIVYEHSWSNVICFNTFLNNGYGGIEIRNSCCSAKDSRKDSRENEICFNSIANCDIGVGMWEFSWGNEVHHNTIKECESWGVNVESSDNNRIYYNNVENNHRVGIMVARSDGTQVDHNNIVGNNEGMVVVECTADAKENWWGSADGPSGIGPGSGDIIRINEATVYYEPWLEKAARVKLHGILYIIMSIFGLT